MSHLGDPPETNFKQAQLIHWLALPKEYCSPRIEVALAHKVLGGRPRANFATITLCGTGVDRSWRR
jgi:hypothetical protein